MANTTISEEFMRNFINIYQQHPALWKIKSKSYADRKLKESGHNELLQLYKTIDTSANVETVKKKINNIRSAFRKELKKVKKSTRSGSATTDIYKPSLWYYNLLLFTIDQEEAREGRSNEGSESEELNDNQDYESDILDTEIYSPPEYRSIASSSRSHSRVSDTPSSSSVKKIKLDETKKKEHMLQKISEQLDNEKEDDFDITGKHIANKLRNLSQEQMIYAEKIIMDVLYEAQLGTLNRASKLYISEETENGIQINNAIETDLTPYLQLT